MEHPHVSFTFCFFFLSGMNKVHVPRLVFLGCDGRDIVNLEGQDFVSLSVPQPTAGESYYHCFAV